MAATDCHDCHGCHSLIPPWPLPIVTIVTVVTASCVTITPDNDTGNGQFLVTLNGPVATNTTFKGWDLVG